MKKIVLLLTACALCIVANAQMVIPRQVVHYDVNYKWGIIDVNIAHGTVAFQSDGNNFYGTLDGTSIPWEGRIICVSDTLQATMSLLGGTFSETVDYQAGWYRRPPVDYFRSASYNAANPAYYRNTAGGGSYDASDDTMEAITVTADMIGMYYYSHAIDFSRLQPGNRVNVTIQGPFSRELVITYNGLGEYSAGGRTYPVYDCTFEYGYHGSMSGFPIECKIGTRERFPLYLGASLPVGRVEMLYQGY